ncbi:MAG: transglutaminase domain-containing protein [Planctomycetota bacterium]|nr:transglutaminase domain-containing protein [Planctomycetota bacterium]
MNLYRTLRISLYLLVSTGAFAIWSVEGTPAYLLAVIVASVAAYFTVDARRFRPVRSSLAGALCLLLLVHALVPSIEMIRTNRDTLAISEMTHFLCLVQIALLFTAFRGSVVTFCAANLFIVVVSGIMGPGPGLIVRLFLFLVACTWTLFLAALWRERSRFEGQDASISMRKQAERVALQSELSERTIRQGVTLITMLSVGCIVFGFLLFFTWPRVNLLEGAVSWIRPSSNQPADDGSGGGMLPVRGHGSGSGLQYVGFNEDGVPLNEIADLKNEVTQAMKVVFTPIPSAWAEEDGNRVYLRGLAYDTYAGDKWRMADPKRDVVRSTAGGDTIVFPEERAFGDGAFVRPPGPDKRVSMKVRHTLHRGSVMFTVGAAREIKLADDLGTSVAIDEGGSIRTAKRAEIMPRDSGYTYTMVCNYPLIAEKLPADARVAYLEPEHQDYRQIGEKYVARLRALAQEITYGIEHPRDKALRIRDYLLTSRKYAYSYSARGTGVGGFLFEGPEPHAAPCSYFASAFVMLCRASGLPARLAAGFAHNETREEVASGELTIRNSDAHAWGEVYFDRYGWVTFDATPAAAVADMRSDPQVADLPPKAGPKANGARPDDPKFGQQGMLDDYWDFFSNYSQKDQDRVYGGVSEKLSAAVERAESMLNGSGSWGVAGAVFLWLLLAAAAGVSLIAFLRNQERRRGPQAALPPRARAAVTFYNDLLQVLGKRGYVRRPGQTPREFAEAVVRRGGETMAPVRLVTEVFERVRYGEQDIGADDLDAVKRAFAILQDATPPQPQAT